jgi:stage V sporulation protein B
LRFFSFAVPMGALLGISLSFLMGYERIGWNSFITNIFHNFVRVVVVLLAIYIGFGKDSIIYSYLLGFGFSLILAVIVVYKTSPKILNRTMLDPKKKKEVTRSIFSYSWPLIFVGVLGSLFGWTDSFLIGIFKDAYYVGIYNAAVPTAMLLAVASTLFVQLFFPLVAREYGKNNKSVIKQLSQQVGKWIFLLNVPLLVLIIMFPEVFLNILFGGEYALGSDALRFLAIGYFVMTLFSVSDRLIEMIGKTRVLLYDTVTAVGLNILLNILLIPKYGISGAGFATMSSMIFLTILYAIQSWKFLRIIPLRRKMVFVLLSVAIASLLLVLLKGVVEVNIVSMIIMGIFYLLVYVLLLFVFGSFDRNDWEIIRLIKKRLGFS